MSREYWTGAGGRQIPMDEMEDGHLASTITMLLEKARLLKEEVLGKSAANLSIREVAEDNWPKFKLLVAELESRKDFIPEPVAGDDF